MFGAALGAAAPKGNHSLKPPGSITGEFAEGNEGKAGIQSKQRGRLWCGVLSELRPLWQRNQSTSWEKK